MFQNVLKIHLQGPRTRALWQVKREKRISEALTWDSGTQDNPRKHLITRLSDGTEVYFLKPGKEVFNQKRPNPNDMFPVVGSPDIVLRFDDVWSYLSKISVVDFDQFKAVLTMVYRIAYFIDHVEDRDGNVRYEPNGELIRLIDAIDIEAGAGFPFRLIGLLHFLDLLGWNEDMKYHVEQGRPTFSGAYDVKVGRINTLLTCIRVPYQASLFVTHCISKANDRKNIDFSSLFTIMQQFAKSRGTCTPTQRQLTAWLAPYIIE
jgi:hypothetical protein